jgi:putative MATE family efflux protein
MRPALSGPSSTGIVWPLVVLAAPVLAEESLNMLVGYTDWYLAGHFLPGSEPKAAMSFIAYFLWILTTMFAFVGIGATALIARATGAGDRQLARRVFHQAMLSGLLLAVIVAALTWLAGPPLIELMTPTAESAELARRFVAYVIYAVPAIMIEQIGTACLRGAGDTVSGLVARVFLNLVNVSVSTSLITGVFGLPKLGIEGLALGAVCGHWCGAAIILAILLRGRVGLKWSWPLARFDGELSRRMLRIGLPGGFDLISVIACHMAYAWIIFRLGTDAAAAHGLGVQIEALSYLPGSAFAVAAATLAGQSLGAGRADLAVRRVAVACVGALTVMSCAGLFFYFGGAHLAMFFTGDNSLVTQHTAELLKIVACGCPAMAILQVLSAALRGAGDTRVPLVITFVGLLGIRIPLAALFAWRIVPLTEDLAISGLALGVAGAWLAMVLDVTLRAVLILVRFTGGQWRHVRV